MLDADMVASAFALLGEAEVYIVRVATDKLIIMGAKGKKLIVESERYPGKPYQFKNRSGGRRRGNRKSFGKVQAESVKAIAGGVNEASRVRLLHELSPATHRDHLE